MPIAISVNMFRLRVSKRLPAAHEEWPACPQYDRRRESELHGVRERRIDPIVRAGEVRAHFEDEDRDRQRKTDPEPARHVDKFGIRTGVAARELRLERHAADRAGAGTELSDLRMHRTRVDGAFGDRLRLARAQIFLRIVDEFRAAAGRAEIIGVAVIIGAVLGGVRIDRHAADGVDGAACRRVCVMA